jgi:hypothetical protein
MGASMSSAWGTVVVVRTVRFFETGADQVLFAPESPDRQSQFIMQMTQVQATHSWFAHFWRAKMKFTPHFEPAEYPQ